MGYSLNDCNKIMPIHLATKYNCSLKTIYSKRNKVIPTTKNEMLHMTCSQFTNKIYLQHYNSIGKTVKS